MESLKNSQNPTVLIVSISGDKSTDDVMDWLSHYSCDVIRFNVDEDLTKNKDSLSFEFSNYKNETILNSKGININIDKVKTVWFRKYKTPVFLNSETKSNMINNDRDELVKHLTKEYTAGMFAIFDTWSLNKNTLGCKITRKPSKMEMLLAAKSVKLDIPKTLITTKKSKLISFITENKEVITKTIKDARGFRKTNNDSTKMSASLYTELINSYLLEKIPETFFPSLFQEKLDKDIEIRSFFLNGKIFSSAIFSQLDEQTDIDFRMYNNRKPNRTIALNLPSIIEKKIRNLMSALELTTGSIDLIKTKNNRFVFLEVNPWGQYDMVSKPCNYGLDKKIAEYLLKLEYGKG